MKKLVLYAGMVAMIFAVQLAVGQNGKKFKMEGENKIDLAVNETFMASAEIEPFESAPSKIYGLAVSAEIKFDNEESMVRFVLVDKNYKEYLIYETYPLLESDAQFTVNEVCEETSVLNGVHAQLLRIEITEAEVTLEKLSWSTNITPGLNVEKVKKTKKKEQNEVKIQKINESLEKSGKNWRAGRTAISEMTYEEKKSLYGQSTFPAGFEYYAGGIISTGTELNLKTAAIQSPYIGYWDWRNRHGKNFISPIKNQGACGSCWSFAAAGATEAMVNLYFNQEIHLDLSEQELISCSTAGGCSGGYPSIALNYITNTGIVDENTFPYTAAEPNCNEKGNNPAELIKIGGRVDFGSSAYPKTEDDLKRMLIEMGPVSGGLYDWSHAMVLVGYKVVEEGDVFYHRNLDLRLNWVTIQAGDPLIGKTVWIFKNSWGIGHGDEGYVYVETPISNVGWTHGLKTPVISGVKNYNVVCEDIDGDGYYWWGFGPKPATCGGPNVPDGDDSDPTLGPLDQYGYCIVLENPPVADFKSENVVITEGEYITFSDLSSSNTTSWNWSFEGGTPATSTEQNPIVKYDVPGTYNVSLTVSNSNGSDTKTVSDYIKVEEFVPAYCSINGTTAEEWIAKVQIGAAQITSSYSSKGYSDYSGVFTFKADGGSTQNFALKPGFAGTSFAEYWRIWIDYNGDADFDDAGELVYSSTSSSGEITGTFSVPSNLNLTTRMRVAMKRGSFPAACGSYSYGEVEDYTIQITSPISLSPVASFNSDKTHVTEGSSVSFTDLSTNNPTSWSWTFEGGEPATSTSQNPTVSYATAGLYDVSLTVSNSNGSDTKTISGYITVEDGSPVAGFTADNTTVTEGETVSFTDASGNNPTSWSWTFEGGNPSTSTVQNPSVSYTSAGSYSVTLEVSNSFGTDTKSVTNYITVKEGMPVAGFTTDKNSLIEGGSVSFTDISTNNPTAWSWTFEGGDPATSSAQNPIITYHSAGTYDVTLTVENETGTDTEIVYGYISVAEGIPVADFSGDKILTSEGGTVVFTDLSTNNPTSWSWTFEGGEPATSDLQNPSVSYAAVGVYNVSLTVSNATGTDSKTISGYITVQEGLPAADFTADKTTVTKGGSVLFTDLSTNNPTSCSWTFEGGVPATSISQNPSVTYAAAGVYDVSLTVSNATGTDSKTVTGYITVQEGLPVADFTADKTAVTEGGGVLFTDLSTNNPISWSWTFEGGEPATSASQNPSVSYAAAGSYAVTLEVSNATGTDSKTVSGYITVEQTVPAYCSAYGDASSEWISRVVLGDMNHTSGPSGYEDFTSVTVNMVYGNTYILNLEQGSYSSPKFQNWAVWIDFNGDFDFSDAGEQVFTMSKSRNASGSIVIPENAVATTRMRVGMSRTEMPTTCGYNGLGEYEDYTVSFSEPVPMPPEADFVAASTSVMVEESVQFSDNSSNNPTGWQWSFPGGTPSSSTEQNPVVKYSSPGSYDVTLIVSKEGFNSSKKTKLKYVSAFETPLVSYCEPAAVNSSFDYIQNVSVENLLSSTTSGNGYSFFQNAVSIMPGRSYSVSLTPYDSRNRNFWRIWIDFNGDGDFDDFDETVVAENNAKGVVNTGLTIPAYATGSTKMRVTMKTGKSPSSCDDNFEGEVEDYMVSFESAPMMQLLGGVDGLTDGSRAKIYPNPVNEVINVMLDKYEAGDSFAIYNMNGKIIASGTIDSDVTSVPFKQHSPGVYLMVVFNKENIFKQKFIKR